DPTPYEDSPLELCYQLAVLPDGGFVCVSRPRYVLRSYVAITDPNGQVIRRGETVENHWFDLSPAGDTITISQRKSIQVIEAVTGKPRFTIDVPGGLCSQAAYTPDGRQLCTVLEDGRIVRWDVATGKKLSDSDPVEESGVLPDHVAVSPDGKRAAWVRAGVLETVDATTGKLLWRPS